ncbi:Flp family type IVb pilin [Arenibaculum sp.]|jgi:pilus assembly protein Flp/PilA|uniref:Flp family type IVb pilin n=1 Tax=Arenibaculum sp. TaxID=2865862 RepID=UPI002E0F8C33|nr:Flp family type IVb pilin [Arenibaculum sp.]
MKFCSLRKFVSDESGATAIEYGLIAALVSVAAIVALNSMGGSLRSMFTTVSTQLNSATPATGGGGTTGGDTTGGDTTGGDTTGGDTTPTE